ncbi:MULTISPECIES: hypothetical protein [Micromonospora]|uniref:hypothetical protein n=1 Tax=Micromonospora TaxID=1873 RepID=UPI0012FD034A|nr:hypothetical protein [Micromonospora coriariae]
MIGKPFDQPDARAAGAWFQGGDVLPIAGQERYYGGTGVRPLRVAVEGTGFGQPGKVGVAVDPAVRQTGELLILDDFPEAELGELGRRGQYAPVPVYRNVGDRANGLGPHALDELDPQYERVRIAWWLGSPPNVVMTCGEDPHRHESGKGTRDE